MDVTRHGGGRHEGGRGGIPGTRQARSTARRPPRRSRRLPAAFAARPAADGAEHGVLHRSDPRRAVGRRRWRRQAERVVGVRLGTAQGTRTGSREALGGLDPADPCSGVPHRGGTGGDRLPSGSSGWSPRVGHSPTSTRRPRRSCSARRWRCGGAGRSRTSRTSRSPRPRSPGSRSCGSRRSRLRIDADLERGLSRELISELESLVRQHPLQERLTGQLMLALYRSARQADALRAYQLLKSRLGEELGIEPSSGLRKLEEQIVTGDEALEIRSAGHGAGRRDGTGPGGPRVRAAGEDRRGRVRGRVPRLSARGRSRGGDQGHPSGARQRRRSSSVASRPKRSSSRGSSTPHRSALRLLA